MEINFKSKRHEKYKEYSEMYDNYEKEWSELRKITNSFNHPYISLPLPRTIVQTYSDLAFGNNISVSIPTNVEADTAINEWIEDNDFNMLLSESSISQAIKGAIVVKNYLDNGVSKVEYIEPEFYFPTVSPTNRRKILNETIAIPFMEGKKKFLHEEIYEKLEDGYFWVTTQVFNYTNDKKGKLITSPDSINTKLTVSPLTYIPFSRSGNSFHGDSIFAGLIDLFDVLNHRVSQINEVLSIHADPSIIADSSMFDDDGNLNLRGSKVFEKLTDNEGKSTGEPPLYYLTWDGQLTANFKFINEILMEILHFASPFLNPALHGQDDASQASGRAISLKSHRTQAMVQRSYQYWRRGIKKILFVAQQLQVISGEKYYIPSIPQVELSQNLPTDKLEIAQSEQLKVDAGLSSKKSSIARLNPHMTPQEVEAEYQAILDEEADIKNQTFMGSPQGFNQPLANVVVDDDTGELNDTE